MREQLETIKLIFGMASRQKALEIRSVDADGITGVKSRKPVKSASAVRVTSNNDVMSVEYFNGEMYARVDGPNASGKILNCVVPFAMLREAAENSEGDMIARETKANMIVKCDNLDYKIKRYGNFDILYDQKRSSDVEIVYCTGQELLYYLSPKFCSGSIGRGLSKELVAMPILTNVALRYADFSLVGSTAIMIGGYAGGMMGSAEGDTVLIPKEYAYTIARFVEPEGDCVMSMRGNKLSITQNNREIVIPTGAGKFPDISAVFKGDERVMVSTIERAKFAKIIKSMAVCFSDKLDHQNIFIRTIGNSIQLCTIGGNGSVVNTLEGNAHPEIVNCTLSIRLLLSLLQGISDKQINFHAVTRGEHCTAVHMVTSDATYVLMTRSFDPVYNNKYITEMEGGDKDDTE